MPGVSERILGNPARVCTSWKRSPISNAISRLPLGGPLGRGESWLLRSASFQFYLPERHNRAVFRYPSLRDSWRVWREKTQEAEGSESELNEQRSANCVVRVWTVI